MISFKSFVTAIHGAILKANDALMEKNTELLNKYFEEKNADVTDENGNPVIDSASGKPKQKKVLEPVSVILDYPIINDDGKLQNVDVHVPLITIVPLVTSQIEKATLTADFEIDIVNNEVQINFEPKKSEGLFSKNKTLTGKFEITISPQDTPEGLRLLIEGYETMIKRQIP